jgi:hypothetical protein
MRACPSGSCSASPIRNPTRLGPSVWARATRELQAAHAAPGRVRDLVQRDGFLDVGADVGLRPPHDARDGRAARPPQPLRMVVGNRAQERVEHEVGEGTAGDVAARERRFRPELLDHKPEQALQALRWSRAPVEDGLESEVFRDRPAQQRGQPLAQARGRDPDREPLVAAGRG